MDAPEMESLATRLRQRYRGVFDAKVMERHLSDHASVDGARDLVREVQLLGSPPGRLLDIGCGYGSFVAAATESGFETVGLDVDAEDLTVARGVTEGGQLVRASGTAIPFADSSFDLVTLWNVAEHVRNLTALLQEAKRVTRPGGHLLLLAPNYAAFRREAHYRVAWLPLLPKPLAAVYLRARGRDPEFLLQSVHYCTNWGVMRRLRQLGMTPFDPRARRAAAPEGIRSSKRRRLIQGLEHVRLSWVFHLVLRASFWNPLRPVVYCAALRPK